MLEFKGKLLSITFFFVSSDDQYVVLYLKVFCNKFNQTFLNKYIYSKKTYFYKNSS